MGLAIMHPLVPLVRPSHHFHSNPTLSVYLVPNLTLPGDHVGETLATGEPYAEGLLPLIMILTPITQTTFSARQSGSLLQRHKVQHLKSLKRGV